MSWNYRVRKMRQRQKFPNGHRVDEVSYQLTYYKKNGKADAYSPVAASPHGSSIGELRRVLVDMLAATYKPIFNYEKECK